MGFLPGLPYRLRSAFTLTMTTLSHNENRGQERKTPMKKNEYESAAVVNIGQAHEVLLGAKEIIEEENSSGQPPDRFPFDFAKFED